MIYLIYQVVEEQKPELQYERYHDELHIHGRACVCKLHYRRGKFGEQVCRNERSDDRRDTVEDRHKDHQNKQRRLRLPNKPRYVK